MITVRKPQFDFTAELAGYWFANDRFMSHFFNALSSIFPEGERTFIHSVRVFADGIDDPELAHAVQGFFLQEGQHSRVHDAHVDALVAAGFPRLAQVNSLQRRGSRWLVGRYPAFALALTAALEQVTAAFAEQLLKDTRWTAPMAPEQARLWRWHALEELEHRAVAFDVYQLQVGRLGLRRAATVLALFFLLTEVCLRHCYLLWADPLRGKLHIAAGLRLLWGQEGLLRAGVRAMRPYWRRDFHPQQHPVEQLLDPAGAGF